MNKVKIITDSTNDLTKELIEKLDILVLPLYVTFGEDSYLDGVDITVNELYPEVEKRGYLPKTAAISIPLLIDTFEKYINEGYDIIFMGPPYRDQNNKMLAFSEPALKNVADARLLAPAGVIVLQTHKTEEFAVPEGLEIYRVEKYGDTLVHFLRYKAD